jgi:hypothetical protein
MEISCNEAMKPSMQTIFPDLESFRRCSDVLYAD